MHHEILQIQCLTTFAEWTLHHSQCRYWLGMYLPIPMNLSASSWSIFLWLTIPNTISLIRFNPISCLEMDWMHRHEFVLSDVNCSAQVVFNANTLSKLIDEKKKLQNWLDFYQLKYSRNKSIRPLTKVIYPCISFSS